MAKKPQQPNPPALFPEGNRRHLHLVLPKLLDAKATQFPFDMFRLEAATKALAHWADLAESQVLHHKEVSLDAEFLHAIFCDALGYKARTDSPDAYHLDREFTVPGAGPVDGVLGNFAVGKQMRPAAVIECKGVTADLDHDKSSGRTPVQQLWD